MIGQTGSPEIDANQDKITILYPNQKDGTSWDMIFPWSFTLLSFLSAKDVNALLIPIIEISRVTNTVLSGIMAYIIFF